MTLRNHYDDDAALDAAIDRYHAGWSAGWRGQPCPADDADTAYGYAEGLYQRQVRVVMPRRPEGYYHAPVGTFD